MRLCLNPATEEDQEHEYTMTENIEASQASRSSEILTNSVSAVATKAPTSDIKANTRTATRYNDTSNTAQLKGTKMKWPALILPLKPTNGGQVIGEGVVEEHLSAGDPIHMFEYESLTFTAVNSMVASASTASSVSLASSSLRIDESEDMVEETTSGDIIGVY